jgi:proton-dependent oligopeptide transporter, POT family
VLGLIVYLIAAQRFLGDVGKVPVHRQKIQQAAEKKPLTKEEKQRIIVIFILVFFVIFFWAGFEQAGSTLNLYTKKYIDKSIFGWEMPTTWFQAINPALILLFGSSFAALWLWLAKKRRDPSTPVKMGLGMIALGLGFFFMVGAVLSRGIDCQDDTVKASFMWIIATYLFHTIGELCLSPIGLSMITKLAPPGRTSLFMGIWFAGIGVALFLSGTVLDIVSKIGAFSVFLSIGIFICLLGVVMLLISKRLVKMMHGVD